MKLSEKKAALLTTLWWLSCTTPVQVPDQTDPIERIDFSFLQEEGKIYLGALVKDPFNGANIKYVTAAWHGTKNFTAGSPDSIILGDNGDFGDILKGDNLYAIICDTLFSKCKEPPPSALNPISFSDTGKVYLKMVAHYEEGESHTDSASFSLGNIFPKFEEICIYEDLDIENCEGPFTLTLPDTGLAKLIKVSAKVKDANGPEDIRWVGFTSKRLYDGMMLNQGNYIFMVDSGNGDDAKNDGIFSTLVHFPYDASQGQLEWRFRVQDWSGGFDDVSKTISVMPPPPVFGSGYPKIDNVETTSFDLKVQIDENGKAYYVVLSDGAEAPSSNEVKAGTGSGGETAIAFGSIPLIASTEASEPITGLSVKTPYDVYVVAEVTPNLQLCPTKVEVSTLQ